MIKSVLKYFTIAGVSLFLLAPAAQAQSVGLDGLHSQVAYRGKVCFVDHEHSNGGSGPTRRAALRDAVGGWKSFTALEYGNEWGRFSLAKRRSGTCNKTSFSGNSKWSCTVTAVACRKQNRRVKSRRSRYRKRSSARG